MRATSGSTRHRDEIIIEVHLYGRLRRHALDSRASADSILRLECSPGDTVRSALSRTCIDHREVCHVFLNGSLIATQNSMAPWLEYHSAGDLSLDTPLHEGDRVGLFGTDMALLVV